MRAEAPMESSHSKVIGPGGGDEAKLKLFWQVLLKDGGDVAKCPETNLKESRIESNRWDGFFLFFVAICCLSCFSFWLYFAEQQQVNCLFSCFKVDKPFLALFVLFWPRGHVGSSLISEIYDNCLFLSKPPSLLISFVFSWPSFCVGFVRGSWHYEFEIFSTIGLPVHL